MAVKSNNHDNFLAFCVNYLRDRGIKHTIKSILFQIKPANLLDDYSLLNGLCNGKRASRGPFSVQIDLTDECNNDCIGCWCNSPLKNNASTEGSRYSLDYLKITHVIDELKRMGTKEITLAGGGEPFMYPSLFQIIKHIKSKKIACQVYSNFTLAKEPSIKELINMEVDNLVISLWAATSKTYCLLHPNKNEYHFNEIRDKLKFLAKIRKKKDRPFVRIHNVITSLNYCEINQMVDFAREMNVNAVSFSVIDAIPGVTESLLLSEEQRDAVIKQCGELGRKLPIFEIDDFLRRISCGTFHQGEYDREIIDTLPCYAGWLFSRISADGTVRPCLKSRGISVGNIYNQSFKEIWNSPSQMEFREKTKMPKAYNSYFSLIGNGQNGKIGCYRVCDDLVRNRLTHRRLTFYLTGRLMSTAVRIGVMQTHLISRMARFLKILYLFIVVICYSLALKIYRAINKIVIFPGE